MTKMPALYLGHGAPILLEDELWTSQLANWAKQIEKPKAILPTEPSRLKKKFSPENDLPGKTSDHA